MANEKNLIPFTSDQSHDEAVKNGKKGGVASGAARRRKRTMRQTVNTLLGAGLDAGDSQFVEEKIKPRLLALGVSVEDATYQDVLLAGIMLKAMRGDVRAAEFIRDTGGDNPHLELKKQELKLRKEELRFKQEQEAKKSEGETMEAQLAEAWLKALLEEAGEDG